MIFESIENIISLLCTIAGLLYCVFKYTETPRPGYRYIIIFFLAAFLSEYYWTVYEFVMRSYPDVSGFLAYLGWNVGFLFLAFSVYHLRKDEVKKYLHPIVFLPVLTNIPQFLLFIQYGGILNNLWQIGLTTATMVFCMQDIVWYWKNKKETVAFPAFSVMVMVYLLAQYGMWTASCYTWSSELTNPYFYLTILSSAIQIFFAYGAGRFYAAEDSGISERSASEMKFHVLVQTMVSFLIIVICAAGVFLAFQLKKNMTNESGIIQDEGQLVVILFVISVVLILLVLFMLFRLHVRRDRILQVQDFKNEMRRNRLNFFGTLAITLALMAGSVIYHNMVLYRASVLSVYEDAEEAVDTNATELENYLTVAMTTLRVVADSVDLMEKNDVSVEGIEHFLVDQTAMQAKQFDENFTGLYAYIDGKFLDGLGWVPPEGYDAAERDWYKIISKAGDEIGIVPPYQDAQTGSIVITIGKCVSGGIVGTKGPLPNVVCLDVIDQYIQDTTKQVEIAGKGYGMVINTDGFIIAHRDDRFNGKNLREVYDPELLDRIRTAKENRTTATIDGEECTLFVAPVMDQWYSVIVIDNNGLYEETYSQLAISIMVSLFSFCMISFFYFIGYKNEQIYGKRVEEKNIQVVSALTTAIDAKDNYTKGHSARVAEYSRKIAARAGYSKAEQDEIHLMGLLHDVGKIGVPDYVINKPSKLTDEEYAIVKNHPVIGSEILGSIKERPKLAAVARWHHECYGGGGYPDGISGEMIPEEARIVAVADAYDTMTSRRSYRDVMPQDKVRAEIVGGMGTQFDPRFAAIMLQMMDEDKEYRMRQFPDE